jgi:transcriptional regulator with XRE-family HTH domain
MKVEEKARRMWKLTQKDVEEMTGVPQARLSEYERGMPPAPEHARVLAHFFGIGLDRIFADVPPEVPPPPDLAERIRELRAKERR